MAGRRSSTRLSRKSTKGKGKRWLKGQSSSSNPETKKYRELARNNFFQVGAGINSNLTSDALEKHNAVLQVASIDCQDENESAIETDSFGGRTFDTFASNWTNCTNLTFSRFLTKWNPDSAVHKDRLAVLAAVTEVIKSRGGKETETEYFAALMTTLSALDTVDLTAACVMLLGLVIKRLPSSVLKVKFPEASKTFLEMLAKHADGEHPNLSKGLIGCLTVMLRAQEAAIWSNSSTMQTYQVLLSFTTHVKPRVRKAAHYAVCSILKASAIVLTSDAPINHPAASVTAKYLIRRLEEHGNDDVVSTLHVLNLLKDVGSTFPKPSLKVCCENILRLLAANNVLLTSCCLGALHGLFIDRPKAANLPAELQAQLITALYDFQPSPDDTQPTLAWLAVVREAHINLHRLDPKLCFGHMAHFFTVAIRLWLSVRPEVRSEVTSTLSGLLRECANPEEVATLLAATPPEGVTPIHRILICLEDGLTFGYHAAWNGVLHVLATFFEHLGPTCGGIMDNCLHTLADLRKNPMFPFISELDYAVGRAIRGAGPQVVLRAIPLDPNDESLHQSWIVPVLRDNVRNTRLAYFGQLMVPLATQLRRKSDALQADGKSALSTSYRLLYNQLWSTLPGFCNTPVDLAESFPTIAKPLGSMLADSDEQRMDVMAALRTLVLKNLDNAENRSVLARFAKNYVPILLNLYTSESCHVAHRLAANETIKVYLQIADTELRVLLLDKAIERVENPVTNLFVKRSVTDLAHALICCADDERVGKLHHIYLPLLKCDDRTLQKKAYKIFEKLCSAETDACRRFIQTSLTSLKKTFVDVLASSIPSSKAPRLRCLRHIVKQLGEKDRHFLIGLVPEVIFCTKETVLKVKSTAFALLIDIAYKLLEIGGKSEEDILNEYVHVLSAGLVGSTQSIGASIVSLGYVLEQLKDKLSATVIRGVLKNVFHLLASETRETVRAALDFMATIISTLGDAKVAHYLDTIIESLSRIRTECRSQCRMRIRRIFQRLIRKFGFGAIQHLVPECYENLLRYVRKQESRAKRLKASHGGSNRNDDGEDDYEKDVSKGVGTSKTLEDLLKDSDDESIEDDERERKGSSRSKKKAAGAAAWIQETADDDIIDLLDPKASKNIMATRPVALNKSRAAKKDEFRVASDGRLIIVDDDEDDNDKEDQKSVSGDNVKVKIRGEKRKRNDDNDEEDDDDDTASGTHRKYKAGGIGIHRPLKKPVKRSDGFSGAEYKSKKGGGDMKKKGKPDPYAYYPLNSSALNKRKRAKIAGQFKGIVGAAKKGARKGRQDHNSKRRR